jgi:protein-S-isoprenylcysteine O-methyltransferase Ste14
MYYDLIKQHNHLYIKEGDMAIAMVSESVTHDSPGVNIMPPTVFYACLGLGGALEFLIPTDLPAFSRLTQIFLGLAIGGAGFAFMLKAHETFKRLNTHVPTNLPATIFVVRGAYRISRNPMYVGGAAFFLGIGLAVGSVWMLAAYIPLGLYLSLYVIPREEDYMQRTFGNDYRAYCRKVRRWL